MQPGSSQRCVVGGQEAAAQAETLEAQAGDKEKLFPHKDSPEVGLGPREVGLSPALGGFMP